MTKFQIKGLNSFNAAAANLTVTKVPTKAFRQYESDYFFNCLLEYASSTDTTSITAYVKSKKTYPNLHFYVIITEVVYRTTKNMVPSTQKLRNSSSQNILRRRMLMQKPKFFLLKIAVAISLQMKSGH